jgi:hypothetical protein
VYPGAIEEDCLPVLEKSSGLLGATSRSAIHRGVSILETSSTDSRLSARWWRGKIRVLWRSLPRCMNPS